MHKLLGSWRGFNEIAGIWQRRRPQAGLGPGVRAAFIAEQIIARWPITASAEDQKS
jgi:hypothetical protein